MGKSPFKVLTVFRRPTTGGCSQRCCCEAWRLLYKKSALWHNCEAESTKYKLFFHFWMGIIQRLHHFHNLDPFLVRAYKLSSGFKWRWSEFGARGEWLQNQWLQSGAAQHEACGQCQVSEEHFRERWRGSTHDVLLFDRARISSARPNDTSVCASGRATHLSNVTHVKHGVNRQRRTGSVRAEEE